MDLDRALMVFKLYCWLFERDRCKAESLLLTDEEKQAILELKDLIKEYGGLTEIGEHAVVVRAA